MRNLWRTTASLLRRYPILWLPALLAEALGFTIRHFEHIFHHWLVDQLIPWQSQTHSVLSNSPINASPTQHGLNRIILLLTPLQWSTQFLSQWIYACALVATAAILQRITETGHKSLRTGIDAIAASTSRIVIFALKLFGLFLIGGWLNILIISRMLQLQNAWERTTSQSLAFQSNIEKLNLASILPSLAVALCIAFVIAPITVKLLQPPNSTLTPQQVNRGRFAAYVAVAAITILQILDRMIAAPLYQLSPGLGFLFAIGLASSLILALPNAPLFIAYSLIASPDSLAIIQAEPHLTDDFPTE